jgi:hypothetical protein
MNQMFNVDESREGIRAKDNAGDDFGFADNGRGGLVL